MVERGLPPSRGRRRGGADEACGSSALGAKAGEPAAEVPVEEPLSGAGIASLLGRCGSGKPGALDGLDDDRGSGLTVDVDVVLSCFSSEIGTGNRGGAESDLVGVNSSARENGPFRLMGVGGMTELTTDATILGRGATSR